MLRVLSRFVLRMFGWTVKKDLPLKEKYVLVAAPHTSNWDFPLGILGMSAMGLRFRWVGKHTISRGPIGLMLRLHELRNGLQSSDWIAIAKNT